MIVYFIRHGHSDYNNDCLTELGHRQAKAVAERLKDSGIKQIYSSSNGRALQTAEYTANRLGLKVNSYDFMREISWRPIDDQNTLANGEPWNMVNICVSEGKSLLDGGWQTNEPYCKSRVAKGVNTVVQGLDVWLEVLGYMREGEYYRVVGEDLERKVAFFGHETASMAAISHMLNIPFPQFCGAFRMDYTAITVLYLPGKKGDIIYPKVLLLNDAKHIGT